MGMAGTVPTVSAALYLLLFRIREALVAVHGQNTILLQDGSGL